MAIVINNTPQDYSSAHGDLVYTVYEATKANDATTYPNYKYVCDVYIAGTMVVRLKAFPNPVNKRGIFNIGMIVRNYVNALFNPTNNVVKAQELTAYFASVQCKFGEEYAGTLYTNLTTDSARNYFNHYNGRLVGGYTILPNYTDTFASNRPGATNVQLNGGQVFIPYFPTTTNAITLNVKSYDSNGTQLASNNITITPSGANYLQQLNVSPIAINSIASGAIPANTTYYTVTNGTKTYKFNIYCEPRFNPFTIHFLNQLGGYDSFDFPKSSKKSIDITKKDFTQLGYIINADGSMTYYNGTVLNDNKIVYYGDSVESKILNTDYITEDTYTWLSELLRSPQIYLEQSGYYIPVVITDTKYEYKTRAVDRLFNLTLNIQFGDDQNVQYR
jgi:hypothetical protein